MTEPNPWQAPEQPVPAPALPQAGEEQPVTGCSFKDAIIRYWKGYVRFRGRASRSESWWLGRSVLPIERLLGTRHHPADHRHLMASPP